MDAKSTLASSSAAAAMPPRSRPVVRLTLLALVLCALGYYYSYTRPLSVSSKYHLSSLSPKIALSVNHKKLVPLEAHIISKCPDTRDALRQLILPAMQRVSDKVDFKLNYIGTLTDSDDSIKCKHGPSECLGNIIELCARELYPDPKINLGFIMCLTKDYTHIPDRGLIEDCALEHAIDFNALNECATRDDGAHGLGMLRDSVERTAKANVTMSCTIRLNDEIYCIRDGGEWKNCPNGPEVNSLVAAIDAIAHSSSS